MNETTKGIKLPSFADLPCYDNLCADMLKNVWELTLQLSTNHNFLVFWVVDRVSETIDDDMYVHSIIIWVDLPPPLEKMPDN